jgi:hypothetical protein
VQGDGRETPRAAFEYPPPRAAKRVRLPSRSSGYPCCLGGGKGTRRWAVWPDAVGDLRQPPENTSKEDI